jgi:TyrR family helix-turn-helix protein
VVPLHIPPLRERREDIPLLIKYFADQYNRKYHSYKRFSEQLIQQMSVLPWRGNIRELENVVERLIVTSKGNTLNDLDTLLQPGSKPGQERQGLPDLVQAYEDEILTDAWRRHGTTRRLAKALGISQATAARKLKNLKARLGRTD